MLPLSSKWVAVAQWSRYRIMSGMSDEKVQKINENTGNMAVGDEPHYFEPHSREEIPEQEFHLSKLSYHANGRTLGIDRFD
ncbi:hypothetical protein TNCV_4951281 [Trichonephila clavipes]|nr:hypothetical protein TNCV_4951281 [Trichonephila clavipes]